MKTTIVLYNWYNQLHREGFVDGWFIPNKESSDEINEFLKTTNMTAKDWLIAFDVEHPKFKWFFLEYGFTKQWYLLMEIRSHECECKSDEDRMFKMKTIMNEVWFKLPDNIFNIMVNPRGWSSFLNLIEE